MQPTPTPRTGSTVSCIHPQPPCGRMSSATRQPKRPPFTIRPSRYGRPNNNCLRPTEALLDLPFIPFSAPSCPQPSSPTLQGCLPQTCTSHHPCKPSASWSQNCSPACGILHFEDLAPGRSISKRIPSPFKRMCQQQ